MISHNNRSKTERKIIDSGRQLTHEQQRVINYAVAKQNEAFRTTINKLVRDDRGGSHLNKGNVPTNVLKERTMRTMGDIRDIRAIQRSLPESETAQDILVSSIISPNDMVSEEMTWTLEGTFPGSLGQKLLAVVKSYFTDEFKLDRRLSTYLGNALFNQGSHILAVFPESAIDDIINCRSTISMESYRADVEKIIDRANGRIIGKGSLGRGLLKQHEEKQGTPSFGLESFFFSKDPIRKEDKSYDDIIPGLLCITDNEDVIKLPMLKRRIIRDDVDNKYRNHAIATESVMLKPPLTEEEEEAMPIEGFYRDPIRNNGNQNIAVVNDKDGTTRRSLGHPMCIDMPHESCIPVFTPGNAEDHIGYIFVLDQSGNPVTYLTEQNNLNEMDNNFKSFSNSNQNNGSTIQSHTVMRQTLTDLSNLVAGANTDNFDKMNLDTLREFYTRIVERDITARFNDGIYGKDVSIPRVSEVYNIMLARALAGSATQLLFMPASLVTYIAFYYDDFGIGESLISRSKNLAALRIASLYANSVAVVKNAIGTRQLRINLDPDVADGEERIAKIVNQYMESNSITPLFHSYDPVKISESLFRSSLELIVEGNDSMDQTTVQTEYKSGDRPLIDNDYMESSKKDLINSWHVIPTLYDDSETPQFSAEFVTKNALYLKRNYVRALRFNAFLKEFVEKEVRHDGALIDEMSKIIREGYGVLDQELIDAARKENSTMPIIEEFLTCLYPRIPLPELETDSQIKNAWSEYKTKVENYLEVMVDSELLGHLIREDDPEKKKEIKGNVVNLIKNFFLSDWIRKKNAFPEFDELFFVDGKPNPEIIKQLIDHQDSIADMVGDIVNLYYERANPSGDGGDDSSSTSSASGDGDGFSTDDDTSDTDDTSSETEEDTGTEEEEEPEEEKTDDTEEEPEETEDEPSEDDTGEDTSEDAGDNQEDDTSDLENLSAE